MNVKRSILDSVQELKLFGKEIECLEFHDIDTASLYLNLHWKSVAFVLRLGMINYNRVNEKVTISKKELEKCKSSWLYPILANEGKLDPHKKVDKDPANTFSLCDKDATKEFKISNIEKYLHPFLLAELEWFQRNELIYFKVKDVELIIKETQKALMVHRVSPAFKR